MKNERKHILIADSDELSLIKLERMLEDDGFETTTAWTTSETVNLLMTSHFDLVLIADHPPELDCELLIRRVRSKGQTPLLVLETKPRHPFAEPFLMNLGANQVVRKGHIGDVEQAVKGMLNKA